MKCVLQCSLHLKSPVVTSLAVSDESCKVLRTLSCMLRRSRAWPPGAIFMAALSSLHPQDTPVTTARPTHVSMQVTPWFCFDLHLDIVDGNLKSIMRLILALAAHFKPGSSKAANQAPSSMTGKGSVGPASVLTSHRPHSATAVAQGAVAALADVRQDISRSGQDVFRHGRR